MFVSHILLKNISDAHAFVHLCDRVDCLVELRQGPTFIDGRSIIGILSLNLTAPIQVEVPSCTPAQEAYIKEHIRPFEIPTE